MARKPNLSALTRELDPSLRTAATQNTRQPPGIPRHSFWICWASIALVVAIAWSNSLSVPFILDDEESIISNGSIRARDIGLWLTPPSERGETVSGRPLLNLSFALNYAVGGLDVRGYHLINTGIHCLAGVLLFGLLRRTPFEPGRITREPTPRRWDSCYQSPWLALIVVLLWVLHPLQTAAVTYVSQRAEVLAGFFYLLTLYAFVRAAHPSSRTRFWEGLSVAACLLGVATKETVATAPLMALLYDRTFLAGSFRQALRTRRNIYIGFIACWVVLGVLVAANAGRGGSAGAAPPAGVWTYLLTQCEAIVIYLRLTFWPIGQVFDYGMPAAQGLAAAWPEALFLLLVAASVGLAVWNRWAVGFWGAWFFVLLAPSSSVIVIATQTVAEHRMYLPLLGVILLVAVSLTRILDRISPRLAWGVLYCLVAALGVATFARNEVYRSSLSLWADTVAKRPDNPRAHHNLGVALAREGRRGAARAAYARVLALQPTHAFAHFNLGVLSVQDSDWAAAVDHLYAAVKADPNYADARINLAYALRRLGRGDESMEQYRLALALVPEALDVRTAYGGALVEAGRVAEGTAQLREVLRGDPAFAEAHYELGRALEKDGRRREADAAFAEALRWDIGAAKYHLARGNNQRALGSVRDAESSYRQAVRLEPGSAEARYALGNILARRQAFAEAIDELRAALVSDPAHIEARNNLGNCLLVTGRISEAIACYDEVLRLRPKDPMALENREIARQALRESMGR